MTITSPTVITGADRAQLREMLQPHLDVLYTPNGQLMLLADKLDGLRFWHLRRILYQPESARRIGGSDTWYAREWYHSRDSSEETSGQAMLASSGKEGSGA